MFRKLVLLTVCATASAWAYSVQVNPADLHVAGADYPGFFGYQLVNLEGGHPLPVNPGEPSLPGLAVSLALPPGSEIASVEVTYAEPEVFPGSYQLFPAQKPQPIGTSPSEAILPNGEIYSSSKPFPGNVVYSFGSGNMSGYAMGSVLFAPVQYVPATGQLLVYRDINFDLDLRPAKGEWDYPEIRMDWVDAQIRADIASMVINPGEIVASPGTRILSGYEAITADPLPYLVITNASMASAAQAFADWKTKKGVKTAVLTTEYINSFWSGVDLAAKVRLCIRNHYKLKATQYVCLMGTNAVIPVRKVYDAGYDVQEGDGLIPTDNYYACINGTFNADGDGYWGEYTDDDVDWYYDLYVGRVQVDTPAAMNEVIDKTKCFEGTNTASEINPYDYLNKAILAGAWLDSGTNCGVLMQYVRDNYLTNGSWTFTQLWDTSYPGGSVFNRTAFINAMNAGSGIVAHAAHSNTTLIGTNSGNVTNTDLNGLTNHPRFIGSLYSLGCYDGNTDYSYNCAAYFVNAANGGGAGFVGNTRYGWYSPGNPANGYSAEFEKSFYQQFGTNDVYLPGKAVAEHKHALQSYVSNVTYRFIYFELYLTGDPELWLFNNTVRTLAVNYTASIPLGSQNYTVHVGQSGGGNVAGALVCVWKGNEVYGSGTTDAAGNISFSINPTTNGTMYLTVSAHNYKTFEANVTCGSKEVTLGSFVGRRTTAGVQLTWKVASAYKRSYNLLRRSVGDAVSAAAPGPAASAESENWVQINPRAITALDAGSYLDRKVGDNVYEYRLELVTPKGGVELGTARVSGAKPAAFALNIAPNPVRDVANITLGLEETGAVKVNLYDLSGRKVSEVFDGVMSAGEHKVVINATPLPAGIYLLRLETGKNVATKRLAVAH